MAEKIPKSSSLNWKPTPRQIRAITHLAVRLRITEPLEETPRNRREARDLIYQLRMRLKENELK